MQRDIDPTQLVEDWLGNNIALSCPLCRKVFVVSGLLNRGGRKCPKCGNSVGVVEGGRDSGGSATIQIEGPQMTSLHAEQIATLINQGNRLSREYEGKDILCFACNYEYETRDGNVVSCVERKRVQWYQWVVSMGGLPSLGCAAMGASGAGFNCLSQG
jgi:hypothetical protein